MILGRREPNRQQPFTWRVNILAQVPLSRNKLMYLKRPLRIGDSSTKVNTLVLCSGTDSEVRQTTGHRRTTKRGSALFKPQVEHTYLRPAFAERLFSDQLREIGVKSIGYPSSEHIVADAMVTVPRQAVCVTSGQIANETKCAFPLATTDESYGAAREWCRNLAA